MQIGGCTQSQQLEQGQDNAGTLHDMLNSTFAMVQYVHHHILECTRHKEQRELIQDMLLLLQTNKTELGFKDEQSYDHIPVSSASVAHMHLHPPVNQTAMTTVEHDVHLQHYKFAVQMQQRTLQEQESHAVADMIVLQKLLDPMAMLHVHHKRGYDRMLRVHRE